MINPERIKQEFIALASIDSPSRREAKVSAYVRDELRRLGCMVWEDEAGSKVGGECGNILAKFAGPGKSRIPLMLNAHLDTVKPGVDIKPMFREGKFYSAGETILGADDKSGIVVLLEALRVLKEGGIPFGELGIVITICEEIGLLGAKNLDFDKLPYKYAISLDHTERDAIINRAPAAYRMIFRVHGREAHAGICPEKGISAIHIASQAIAGLRLGRLDEETTANIGIIQGGTATNIVPALAEVQGEVRSHNLDKLGWEVQQIRKAFSLAVDAARPEPRAELPKLEEEIFQEYPLVCVNENSPLINLVQKGASHLGHKLRLVTSGGGSDANKKLSLWARGCRMFTLQRSQFCWKIW